MAAKSTPPCKIVNIGHTRYRLLRWLRSAILVFEILKFSIFFGRRKGRNTSVHRHRNFINIDQIIAEISHVTTVKMAAIRHLGFLKI